MRQESLQVIFEQTPKAVVGGTIAIPGAGTPERNYLVIVSRYDADIPLPSTDGVFYDIHILSHDELDDPNGGAYRYIISDVTAHSAEPFWPLKESELYPPLDEATHLNVGRILAYTTYDAEATEEALQCLEWARIIEPRGTFDSEMPDTPFYNFTQVLKAEWQG